MGNIHCRYDIEGLARDMEIELGDLPALYSEYFLEMRINLQESRAMYNIKDWDKLERVIHNIKGISTSLNVDDVYLLSNKLDNKLKGANFDNVLPDIDYITDLFIAAENDIKEFFKQNDIKI